jgi:CRISPR/Cas system-associated exonuclease Cas4 (RecB family)
VQYTHVDLVELFDISSSTTSKGRYYTTPQGCVYPSITTILGSGPKPWLESWRASLGPTNADKVAKKAADRGTAVHSMAEQVLNNNVNPTKGFDSEHIAVFNKLRIPLKKINNIIAQETTLWSDQLQVAGRVDCIAEYNGKLSIIDFKTSTSDKKSDQIRDYYLQATGYALMFLEMYGISIDNIVIIIAVEGGIVPLIFEQSIDDYVLPLIERINKFHTTIK